MSSLPSLSHACGSSSASDAPSRALLLSLERHTAAIFEIPLDALRRGSRGTACAALARQCAIYLAHVEFGLPISEVARAFGRDRATAVHACHVVEDRRDRADLDTKLAAIENCVRQEVQP